MGITNRARIAHYVQQEIRRTGSNKRPLTAKQRKRVRKNTNKLLAP